MTYKTKQRDAILQFFSASPHISYTAREVIEALSVGEATVFRNLTMLTKEGLLKRFSDKNGAVYQFSGCDGHHMHLKCKLCGTLVHLDCLFAEEISHHFAKEHGFLLDQEQTVLYGLCENCGKGAKS